MITDLYLFRQVVVGSCAIVAREPGQGRKAAALSESRSVPQIAWPPPSGTGIGQCSASRRPVSGGSFSTPI